jgi:Site-specific recombinase XerD
MAFSFEEYLKKKNLSQNTIKSYLFTVKQYQSKYLIINKKNLQAYKTFLVENYKIKTVNLRIQAINTYLKYLKKETLRLPLLKLQQKNFLENVISEADYEYFKKCLKNDKEMYWYFVIRFITATGARISELIQFKVEHVKFGYFDLYSKGGKLRRIYIPQKLQEEALKWFEQNNITEGFIFKNKYGNKITARGISGELKKLGIKYGLDPKVIYPHSFRHRFAKSFLDRFNDISLLADLMGHESIETTRIYLRRTSTEQQEIVNKIIDW